MAKKVNIWSLVNKNTDFRKNLHWGKFFSIFLFQIKSVGSGQAHTHKKSKVAKINDEGMVKKK